MAGSFDGKVAVVTGGAKGIGRAVVLGLISEGASVAIVDRDGAAAHALAEQLGADMAVHVEICDVRDRDAASPALATIAAAFGGVDILVNNAGVGAQRTLLETGLDLWDDMLAVNLTSCFTWSKAVAPMMMARRGGRIVNVSSHAGLLGSTGRGAYSAAKAGMLALTRVMAVEWAEFGITVNAVAPGAITTPMTALSHTVERTTAWMNEIPIQRYGRPEEVASAVLYLCSAAAGYVTGQTISVDGGFGVAGVLIRKPWQPDSDDHSK